MTYRWREEINRNEQIETILTDTLTHISCDEILDAVAQSNFSAELIHAVRTTNMPSLGLEFYNLIEEYLRWKIEKEYDRTSLTEQFRQK